MDDLNSEQTLPPARAIRFDRVADLFGRVPQIEEFMHERPQGDEGYRGFLDRLRSSQTPEDAITFTAFAIEPKVAIQWGLDCVLAIQGDLTPEETMLVNWIAEWLEEPTTDARWKTLQMAMFAQRRTAVVHLGMAVGWSGGPLAPNDLVTVPPWRAPRAISAAVLRAIGQVQTEHRQATLDHVLDRAAGLFRIH
ncbi:hypothetical protein [uncultured Tateyamaria sp.]|uniref:DUF6931 family protein n=1 Tax=uncultured Tateyamaria sp. TaxID=455651 RepID=UPI002639BA1D|nr:hypothetical protein [uncultured Tateyamaria sp.]